MFPSLDISFMSENCDRKGCNLGIRLNINFSNKTLLFCLMVRQKNVYNLYMCFVSTKCTCKKCCAKKWQLFCSMERHQKRGTRRKQENKSCSLDRHKNHVPKNPVDPMLGLFADICGKPRFLTSVGIV